MDRAINFGMLVLMGVQAYIAYLALPRTGGAVTGPPTSTATYWPFAGMLVLMLLTWLPVAYVYLFSSNLTVGRIGIPAVARDDAKRGFVIYPLSLTNSGSPTKVSWDVSLRRRGAPDFEEVTVLNDIPQFIAAYYKNIPILNVPTERLIQKMTLNRIGKNITITGALVFMLPKDMETAAVRGATIRVKYRDESGRLETLDFTFDEPAPPPEAAAKPELKPEFAAFFVRNPAWSTVPGMPDGFQVYLRMVLGNLGRPSLATDWRVYRIRPDGAEAPLTILPDTPSFTLVHGKERYPINSSELLPKVASLQKIGGSPHAVDGVLVLSFQHVNISAVNGSRFRVRFKDDLAREYTVTSGPATFNVDDPAVLEPTASKP